MTGNLKAVSSKIINIFWRTTPSLISLPNKIEVQIAYSIYQAVTISILKSEGESCNHLIRSKSFEKLINFYFHEKEFAKSYLEENPLFYRNKFQFQLKEENTILVSHLREKLLEKFKLLENNNELVNFYLQNFRARKSKALRTFTYKEYMTKFESEKI